MRAKFGKSFCFFSLYSGLCHFGPSVILLILLASCTPNSQFPFNTSLLSVASPSPTLSPVPSGARVARIILQQATGGSFDSLQTQGDTAGTTPTPGSGHPARRVFNPDGSLLGSLDYSGNYSINWPRWLTSFEIGISGTQNTAATNPNCATFAGSSEATTPNCYIGPSSTPNYCGAPLGQFRISEADCSISTGSGSSAAATGSGAPTDGIYMRAIFNRAYLGAAENMMVTIEYEASALNAAPRSPTNCLSGGKFLPENCSDFVWRAYLKHSASEVTLPYLLLIPPTFSAILGSNLPPSGAGIGTKQFYLPLASDQNLTTLQISRTTSNFPSLPTLLSTCTQNNALPGNSPLCAGVVFYSITFYRM